MGSKIIFSILSFTLLLLGTSGIGTSAFADALTCSANLSGVQEVPPVNTVASGTATLELNQLMNELTIFIQLQNLVVVETPNASLSDEVVAAHIHRAPGGVNGPIVFGFISPNSDTDGDLILDGEAETIFSIWDGVEGQSTNLGAELNNLQNGELYINIHTIAFLSGEIRGQIFCQPVPAVGGEIIPLDSTMVLIAGTQMTAAWMIPVIVSAIGIGIVIARKF